VSEPLQSSYDSIASAAAAMGQSVSRIRWAKKKGAPGFRGSRVYPAELAPWLKAQEEARGRGLEGEPIDKESWEIRRFRLQCERFELENQKLRDELWDSNTVRASWLFHMRQARQVLVQMATDLAPRIAGRPALECEQLLSATAAEVTGRNSAATVWRRGRMQVHALRRTVRPGRRGSKDFCSGKLQR
jgi:hypothetical protein